MDLGFSDALTAYQNTNLDPKMRPEKYESVVKPATTSAWGKNSNGVPSAWGQQSQPQPQVKGKISRAVWTRWDAYFIDM